MWSPIHHHSEGDVCLCGLHHPPSLCLQHARLSFSLPGYFQGVRRSRYLLLPCCAWRRGAEEGGKVAEGYGGFLKTEMHLNSDLFSGLSQREGANCPEEGTDT